MALKFENAKMERFGLILNAVSNLQIVISSPSPIGSRVCNCQDGTAQLHLHAKKNQQTETPLPLSWDDIVSPPKQRAIHRLTQLLEEMKG